MPVTLILHIAISSLGYLLFGAAFAISCVYIYRDHAIKTKQFKMGDRFPWSLNQLDRALFISLIAGFVFMGIGLLLGIYVHKLVYGIVDLTSPRLIFPFFIWLFYLALLLFRLLTGLRGRIPAQLAACGFSCAALSFLFELHIAG